MSSVPHPADRMQEPEEPHGHTEALPHHAINYYMIFLALVVLTVVTVAIAFHRFHSESINVLLALLVASTKATFVARYFMHLKFEGKLIYLILGVPLVLTVILICALIPPQTGRVSMLGLDLASRRDEIRRQIGVVFQSPSLDKQLTAEENLRHQGHLYGLGGADLSERIDRMLRRVGLSERPRELV